MRQTSLAPRRLNPFWFFDAPAYCGVIDEIRVPSPMPKYRYRLVVRWRVRHSAVGL
jgi:hypothetical protein